jgi:LysM repeat protein
VIQTDFPFHLQTYLVQQGLHPVPEGFMASDLSSLPKRIPDSLSVDSVVFTPVLLPDTAVKRQVNKTTKKSKESGHKYYTVKKGDTLSGIGKKYRISVADIRQMNPRLRNRAILRVGQKVRIS